MAPVEDREEILRGKGGHDVPGAHQLAIQLGASCLSTLDQDLLDGGTCADLAPLFDRPDESVKKGLPAARRIAVREPGLDEFEEVPEHFSG